MQIETVASAKALERASDKKNDIKRARITFTLYCESPLHIGDASSLDPVAAKEGSQTALPIQRGAGGKACISGSSLRGWLRAKLTIEDQISLFGLLGDEWSDARAGCIDVYPALLECGTETIRYGHQRDPVTRAVQSHQLFAKMVVPTGSRFQASIIALAPDANAFQRLLDRLKKVKPCVQDAMGSSKRIGLGRVSVRDLTVEELTASDITKWLNSDEYAVSIWSYANRRTIETPSKPEAKTDEQAVWDLALYPQGPFLCEDASSLEGDCAADSRSGNEVQIKRPLLTRSGGKALIQGSSIKGALRAVATRILRTELLRRQPDATVEQVTTQSDRACEILFGSRHNASRISISDFVGEGRANPEALQRTMHASDRFTGGVSGERLFTVQPLYCERLHGDMEWDERGLTENANRALQLWLALTLREAWLAGFGLGWGVNRGFGDVRLGTAKQAPNDEKWESWLGKALPLANESQTDTAFNDWLQCEIIGSGPKQSPEVTGNCNTEPA